VRSTSVTIPDIPRLMSLLFVLSTDLTISPNDSWFHLTTTSNIHLTVKFVAATYPPASLVTVIQLDISLKNLLKKTHKMWCDWFYEEQQFCVRVGDPTRHRFESPVLQSTQIVKWLFLWRSILSHASGISEIITQYLLPQEVDNID
jgi:hypothetical protein